MKNLVGTFSVFTVSLLASLEGGVVALAPTEASAGVLTRGGASSGISVGAPKSHNRSVRSSTAAMRATAPPLDFKGKSQPDVYASLQKAQLKYEKNYFKWEKKKYKFEQKAYRKEMKEREALAREDKKKQEKIARASKPHSQGAAVDAAREKSAASTVASVIDPRAWFSKKIAKQEEGGLLSFGGADGKSDTKGKEVAAKGTPKRIGFWGHLKRAIFGM